MARFAQASMIISASYKTDIPTFYGEWFVRRLRAGYCKMVNPFGKQIVRVALDRDHVDAFVFWTKNVGPFLPHLAELHELGYPFVVHYAINAYPRALESRVVDAVRGVEHARRLREAYGPDVVVWRYDTIVVSDVTPPAFHVDNFGRLANQLRGTSTEVVVSFAQIYRKTKRNLDRAGRTNGFSWVDPTNDQKRDLLRQLAHLAATRGFRLSVCAQPDLVIPGVQRGRCVDAERIGRVVGRPIRAEPKANRPGCGCCESRDIGAYDTCPHGCAYCYAVSDHDLALGRFRQHDPDAEFLVPPPAGAVEIRSEDHQEKLPWT
jgi:hypothetical protein